MPALPLPQFPLGGVPIGTIVPYVGQLNTLPPNWVLCDGRTVNAPGSPLNGQQTPRLSDNRFFMSVATDTEVLVDGGTNEIPLDPGHQHSFHATTDIETSSVVVKSKANDNTTVGGSPHQHRIDGTVNSAGEHNHGGENRPLFIGVYFILRVA